MNTPSISANRLYMLQLQHQVTAASCNLWITCCL